MNFASHKPKFLTSGLPTHTAQQKRISAEERGYDKEWYRVRWKVAQHKPPCASCGKEWESGFHIDHIQPFRGKHDPLRLDLSNLQSLCPSCHSRKTCTQDGGFGHETCRDQQHQIT